MISLFNTTTKQNERKLVVANLPVTRSIMEPRAVLQLVFYLVNLKGIVALYPWVHLVTVEIVTCDVLFESQEKKML